MNIILNRPNKAAIDSAHGMLILGCLMSSKSKNILEIGIGTGFITNMLLNAIEYNQIGHLTSVDNFHDLGGNFPNEVLENLKLNQKIKVIAPMQERDFVFSCEENSFDFLVSDGDHLHAGEWADQVFKIMKPDAIMFFHDVNSPGYINLKNYKTRSDALNKPNFLFKESSRPDEDCHRGILMVINKK